MSLPLNELFVFALLLLGVLGVYYLLKLHYIFAFGLVQKTSISTAKKQKIEKVKSYVFLFLKVLLFLGLLAMSLFATEMFLEGKSLQGFVVSTWAMIPEGFWLSLFWTLLRIAVLIVVMKYLLKVIFTFLDRQEQKTLLKKRYNNERVKKVYLRLHNGIKFSLVLGVVYRIVHFFPFLEEVSHIFLIALILFMVLASMITLYALYKMLQTRI